MSERPDRLELQRLEFDALDRLMVAYNRMPPVVDDDYPEARHRYEGALTDFLTACKNNRHHLL
jgi:hypothetical protein